MRRHRAVLVAAVLALVAGCGADAGADPGDEPAATSASGAEEGAYPVVLEHQYGTTTVEAEPARVVTVGYTDQDYVLALGVQPVASRYWVGAEDDVTWPWADDLVEAEPEVLQMPELDVEAVAALEPDLVVAVYSGITETEYEQLSGIAPTLAQSGEFDEYAVPWQEVTRSIGAALGRPARAEELVTDLEARFADVREAHPHWQGTELVVATYGTEGFGFFAAGDPRSRFFTQLGFEVPTDLDELAGDRFYGDLSFEEADRLDREVVVWDQLTYVDGGRATVEADPLVSGLAVSREGRSLYLEGDTEDAFGWSTVLSLPFALDGVVPLLEQAAPAP